MGTPHVSIPDPDDLFAPPIFDGDAPLAALALEPGIYMGHVVGDEESAVQITVADDGSVYLAPGRVSD